MGSNQVDVNKEILELLREMKKTLVDISRGTNDSAYISREAYRKEVRRVGMTQLRDGTTETGTGGFLWNRGPIFRETTPEETPQSNIICEDCFALYPSRHLHICADRHEKTKAHRNTVHKPQSQIMREAINEIRTRLDYLESRIEE